MKFKEIIFLFLVIFFASKIYAQAQNLSNDEYYKIIDEKEALANKLFKLVTSGKIKAYRTQDLQQDAIISKKSLEYYRKIISFDWDSTTDVLDGPTDNSKKYGPFYNKVKTYLIIYDEYLLYTDFVGERKFKSIAIIDNRRSVICYINIVEVQNKISKKINKRLKSLNQYGYKQYTDYRENVKDVLKDNFRTTFKNRILKQGLEGNLKCFRGYSIKRVHDGELLIKGNLNVKSVAIPVRDYLYPDDPYAYYDSTVLQWKSNKAISYSFEDEMKVRELKQSLEELYTDTIVLQIRDMLYPDDPYAFIDSMVFDSSFNNIVKMKVLYKLDTLQNIDSVVNGVAFRNGSRLLFAIDIIDLQKIWTKEYLRFLDYKKDKKQKEFDFIILTKSMKKFYFDNLEKNKFSGFYSDRLLQNKILRINDSIEKTNFMERDIENESIIYRDTVSLVVSVNIENNNIKFIIQNDITSYDEKELLDYQIINPTIFYCKQSDFLPYLPKYMQFLMKAVVVE